MTSYAVTALEPSKVLQQQAKQLFSVFDTFDDATSQAEKWIRNGATEVTIWRRLGSPVLKTIVDWEGVDKK